MRYLEVSIKLKETELDPLTCILDDMGLAGFVVDDPQDVRELLDKKCQYDWDYVDESVREKEYEDAKITCYLEDNKEGEALLERIRQAASAFEVSVRDVCDEDWKDNWKEYFKPAKITERIVIKPSWEEYQKQSESELVIELDPGMAFGTGTHPTTTLCIRLMEKYLQSGQSSVLDVGCGSGILSIAAARLGASEITGVDIDPVAVEVSKENVCRNGLEGKIEIRQGDLTKGLAMKVNLVAANLMADLVILLSKDAARHLKAGGIYLSSGILVEKKEMVSDAIRSCGFEILEAPEEGEWCAIAARWPQ